LFTSQLKGFSALWIAWNCWGFRPNTKLVFPVWNVF